MRSLNHAKFLTQMLSFSTILLYYISAINRIKKRCDNLNYSINLHNTTILHLNIIINKHYLKSREYFANHAIYKINS